MTNEDVSHQNSPIGQSQKLVSTKDKTNLMNLIYERWPEDGVK